MANVLMNWGDEDCLEETIVDSWRDAIIRESKVGKETLRDQYRTTCKSLMQAYTCCFIRQVTRLQKLGLSSRKTSNLHHA